jgi:surface antigen Omp85-like protein/surface antigen-like variable number repeat protein
VRALLAAILLAGPEGPALHGTAFDTPVRLFAAQSAPGAAVVAGIQIQGNTATPDDEVRRLADVRVGMPFDDATVDRVASRLKAAKRFERVDVLKRFASIADPSQIMLVIVVDEGPVKIVMTGDPDHPTKVVRRRFPNLLILPVLRREDEYGITYGARLTAPEPRLFGKRSRVTFPLTWGGTKQAGIDVEKRLDNAVFDRINFGASLSRQKNPAFEENDDRARVFLRAEREILHGLWLRSTGGWQRASFEGTADEFAEIGGDVILDTRVDPILARNAIYVRAGVNHMAFADRASTHPVIEGRYGGYSGSVTRTDLDGRGYLGLPLQMVLAARALRVDSDRSLPPYLQPQLGGLSTLRGFPAGYATGDTLVALSTELVVPLTSPLKFARFGVTAFVDRGAVYPKGERLSDQTMLEGYGGGVWFAAALFRLNVAVAHGRGATTRVHVGGNVTF